MTTTHTVRIKPGSKKGPLVEETQDGSLTIFVLERAVDGKANEALVKLLAKHFGVAKSKIQITRGHTSHVKQISII
jgi:uncharacterized protein YggU (UPF0235/DUF167 family)